MQIAERSQKLKKNYISRALWQSVIYIPLSSVSLYSPIQDLSSYTYFRSKNYFALMSRLRKNTSNHVTHYFLFSFQAKIWNIYISNGKNRVPTYLFLIIIHYHPVTCWVISSVTQPPHNVIKMYIYRDVICVMEVTELQILMF